MSSVCFVLSSVSGVFTFGRAFAGVSVGSVGWIEYSVLAVVFTIAGVLACAGVAGGGVWIMVSKYTSRA